MVRQYSKYLIWLIPVIIYAVLFDFLFPLNKVLPGFVLIFESIGALFTTYQLPFNLFYTASGIYVSILAAYLIIYLTAGNIIEVFKNNKDTLKSISILQYIPLPGIIIIFIFWFPASNLAEYIFSISYSLIFLCKIVLLNIKTVRKEYIISAQSLRISTSQIYSKIYWKSVQPAVFKSLSSLHTSLWTIMIFYEFIKGDLGIGYIYRLALEYNDVSILLTLSLIIGLVVFTGNFVIKILYRKIIFWEN